MPEYLSPGVYVEEIEIGGKPIEGVSTSTVGFLGETERGPTEPRLITGFTQYERIYGWYAWKTHKGEMSKSYLPYTVAGFFANGGQRCFVGRIANKRSAKATGTLRGKENIDVSAVGPGIWGNRIGVAIQEASTAKPDQTTDEIFKMVVYYWAETPPTPIIDPGDRNKLKDANRREPEESEEFDNLSWDPDSPDYYLRRIHNHSQFIEVEKSEGGPAGAGGGAAGGAPPAGAGAAAPAGGGAAPAGGAKKPKAAAGAGASQIQLLEGGSDGDAVTLEDYQGNAGDDVPRGLAGLAEKEDISIVCVPNENDIAGLSDAVVAHCERLKDRFAILQAKEDAGEVGDLFPAGGKINSKYAAFYYPWLKITDAATNLPKLIPPGGHVAGIYARSDTDRGVHKAPANEPVRGVIDLQFNLTKGDQDMLNPRGVNCIRSFQGRGILLWGARTTSGDPLWKYVNVRRLFLFLEKSIERSTQWVVFEPNTERLWARVRQSVSDFLTQVWKDGALMGTTPEQAFFVKCDETTMTPNEIETGRLIVVVGVAPARPAEFVIFRLAQWRGGSSLTE